MNCDRCGKTEATVFTTSIVNDEVAKRALCETCYGEEGLSLPFHEGKITETEASTPIDKIDLQLMKSLITPARVEADERVCDRCGMTLAEFRRRRVVGCAQDYVLFADEMDRLVERLHAGKRHVGKVPRSLEMHRIRTHRIKQLEKELGTAVVTEDYELAARLRDRIQALEEAPQDSDR